MVNINGPQGQIKINNLKSKFGGNKMFISYNQNQQPQKSNQVSKASHLNNSRKGNMGTSEVNQRHD